MPRDDITDEDLAFLMEGSSPTYPPTVPIGEEEALRPTSPPHWGTEEQDLRRPDVGRPVYQSKGSQRLTKYPWDVWMDGKPHVAVKGFNFSQSRTQFVTMMHNRARGHDMYLATRVVNDNAVEFCFFDDIGARDTLRDRWRQEEVEAREKYANEVPE